MSEELVTRERAQKHAVTEFEGAMPVPCKDWTAAHRTIVALYDRLDEAEQRAEAAERQSDTLAEQLLIAISDNKRLREFAESIPGRVSPADHCETCGWGQYSHDPDCLYIKAQAALAGEGGEK